MFRVIQLSFCMLLLTDWPQMLALMVGLTPFGTAGMSMRTVVDLVTTYRASGLPDLVGARLFQPLPGALCLLFPLPGRVDNKRVFVRLSGLPLTHVWRVLNPPFFCVRLETKFAQAAMPLVLALLLPTP